MADSGADGIISKARKFEQGNDYARAIETYLSIGPQDTTNIDVLEQVRRQRARLPCSCFPSNALPSPPRSVDFTGPAPPPALHSQCWEKAAELAISFQRHRMHDVVALASSKLQEVGRHQAAGELHEGIDDVQGERARPPAWPRHRQGTSTRSIVGAAVM